MDNEYKNGEVQERVVVEGVVEEVVVTETNTITIHAKRLDGRAPRPETTTTSKTRTLTTESEELGDVINYLPASEEFDDVRKHLHVCKGECNEPEFVFDEKPASDDRKILTGTSTKLEPIDGKDEDYRTVTRTITLMAKRVDDRPGDGDGN